MKSKKESASSVTRHIFTSEEVERLKNQLELQIAREEIIGLLNKNSCSFADWLIIISDAVHEKMAQKHQQNTDCEKERKVLENVSFLFTKLAYFSEILSDWHKQLTLGNELTQKMIDDGHP